MTTDNGRAFNEWLRAQLKAKKMSQRQLAQQSGVDHSTISRLIRGDRMPSLGTATKLARGLREIRDDADTSTALGVVSAGTQNPTARVEYALRADEALAEPQVRQIMEYYLAVRVRRFARTYANVGVNGPTNGNGSGSGNGSTMASGVSSYGRSAGMVAAVGAPTVVRTAPPQRYGAPRPAMRPPRAPGRS
jgi:transcriptional regulator with XRE-family HTH domain